MGTDLIGVVKIEPLDEGIVSDDFTVFEEWPEERAVLKNPEKETEKESKKYKATFIFEIPTTHEQVSYTINIKKLLNAKIIITHKKGINRFNGRKNGAEITDNVKGGRKSTKKARAFRRRYSRRI